MRNVINKASVTVIATAFLFGSSTSWADPIEIINPSFEDPWVGENATGSATGWIVNGSVIGVFNPEVGAFIGPNAFCESNDPIQDFVDDIPDGNQVGFSNDGNDFSQETMATITPGSRYTLKVFVGGRCDSSAGRLGLANQPYTVQILAGGLPVASKSGFNAPNTWFEETIIYDSPLADPNAGKPISVALNNDGFNQLNWDMVTLDGVEELVTCDGFSSPFDQPLLFKKKSKRAIPVKMVLRDVYGNELTDADLSVPPVVQIMRGADTGMDIDGYDGDLLPAGLSDDGNEFRYDPVEMQWVINLATKQYTASGVYEVSVVAGDGSYVIEGCSQAFERLP